MRNLKLNILVMASLLLSPLAGCGLPNTTDRGTANLVNSTPVQSQATAGNNPGLELLIEQKKTNGEIISIGSKGVQSVSIDGFDYPVDQLIKNQLRIDIPSVISGKHELKLSLYSIDEPFTVPLILPNLNQKLFILLRLTIDEPKKEVRKIEYGYDLDRNGIIDRDLSQFESVGTTNFFVIDRNGLRQPISVALDTSNALNTGETVPAGVVPSAGTQPKTDTAQPQTSLVVPKPATTETGTELYPKPPVSNTETIPVPVDPDKSDNVIPADQPQTPLPQLPDLP